MTEGISKERLLEIAIETHDSDDTNHMVLSLFDYLIAECTELDHWLPIDENTPKDRRLNLYWKGYGWFTGSWRMNQYWCDAGLKVPCNINPIYYKLLPEDPK